MESINKIWNDYQDKYTRQVIECTFNLTKNDMLDAMMHESIFIDGVYYEVPEKQLLECLRMKFEGPIKLRLEEIEDQSKFKV